MFQDRKAAGKALAEHLRQPLQGKPAVIVGLARGGVATARAVADVLKLPLDVVCPRKIGAPGHAELAVGAITESGQPVWNEELLRQLGLSPTSMAAAIQEQSDEAQRRLKRFRHGMPERQWKGKTVVLVDDGLATGATMRAALRAARAEGAAQIMVAVPVSPPETLARIAAECDAVICLSTPEFFEAVGQFYEQFDQVSDDEVLALLQQPRADSPDSSRSPVSPMEISIPLQKEPAKDQRLLGNLTQPEGARQLVLFVHGSGSSRWSPRNEMVAAQLQRQGIATLLVDLLTEQEAQQDELTHALRFDIDLLTSRVLETIRWLKTQPATQQLAIGLYGASTGAAAALIAASALGTGVFAVVSRGGRPDLAGDSLLSVRSPTLLIVGGDDTDVLALNQQAFERLQCPKSLTVIPGATHLFEEPGTLERAAQAAVHWFGEYGP
jgi:putative phosphoribosyl transferase